MQTEDAEVVITLEIQVAPADAEPLRAFCREAFPVYESVGGLKMVLYEDPKTPGRFQEVCYYRTAADCARSEAALESDPRQADCIRRWKALLAAPPKVTRWTRLP